MITPPGRQVLLFAAGGVPFAIPLRAVREISPVSAGTAGGVDVAGALGLSGEARYAMHLGDGDRVLLVEAMRGVADLGEGEAFRLPARSWSPSPPGITTSVTRTSKRRAAMARSAAGASSATSTA